MDQREPRAAAAQEVPTGREVTAARRSAVFKAARVAVAAVVVPSAHHPREITAPTAGTTSVAQVVVRVEPEPVAQVQLEAAAPVALDQSQPMAQLAEQAARERTGTRRTARGVAEAAEALEMPAD